MFNVRPLVRSLACGFMVAVVGFTYAFATSRGLEETLPTAGSRALGSTTLRFTNPTVSANTYDLGDGAWGSVLTRYVTVTGGIRPYRTSGQASLDTLLAANSSLKLTRSGALIGSIANGSLLTTPGANFLVTDSLGTSPQNVTGGFVFSMQTGTFSVFRFAMDTINNGILGQTYISKLETVGGVSPVVISVLPGTLTVNGTQVGVGSGLDAVGLTLAADGTIFGRPLLPGLVKFTARATDKLGRTATGRTSATSDQVISFLVEDTLLSASDALAIACSIKGDTSRNNSDTLKFIGLINLNGEGITKLAGGDFAFHIGGASYAGIFNNKGQAVSSKGGPLVFADGTKLSLSVNSKTGQIKGGLTNANLSTLIGASTFQNGGTPRIGFTLALLNYVIHCDAIDFTSRVKGSKYSLDYALSKSGRPTGGAFQILSAAGVDGVDISGNRGDAWRVRFLMVPRFAVDSTAGLDAVNSVRVRIGSKFTQVIPASSLVTSSKGGILLKPEKTKSPVVTKLQIDPRKFVGSLQTNVISQISTGIPRAADAALADPTGISTIANFSLAIDIDRTGTNADFSGEYGKKLYLPNRGSRAPAGATSRQQNWVDQENFK